MTERFGGLAGSRAPTVASHAAVRLIASELDGRRDILLTPAKGGSPKLAVACIPGLLYELARQYIYIYIRKLGL